MITPMIKNFRHKGLEKFHRKGQVGKVKPEQRDTVRMLLDIMESSESLTDANIPGLELHKLKGKPTRYGMKVTGNWRITFEWKDGEFLKVDLEDYH
jgi:proteic killer suppression protein